MQNKKRYFLRIAIVEAEPVFATDIKHCLEESGYNITGVFCSGEEAVRSITEAETDLIVIDVLQNGAFDGIDAAERIMIKKNIPVVFITGIGNKADASRINSFQYCGILFKPFPMGELLNTIEIVYNKYVKSMNFYRDCRNLILEINPYKADFVKKIDSLIDVLAVSEEGQGNVRQLTDLLYQLKEQLQLFINPDKVSLLMNQNFKRSVYSIIKYADYLLEEIDTLDIEDIKKYICRINIYLKVLFTSPENKDVIN